MTAPDYATDPNAVLKDDAKWLYKTAPNYTKTRQYSDESRSAVSFTWGLP